MAFSSALGHAKEEIELIAVPHRVFVLGKLLQEA
jgi:hypothetical protein